ncbi:MAG: maleylpyruvate isomerase family mycothiol-dependent enzyme [Actinomycetes bacterium]
MTATDQADLAGFARALDEMARSTDRLLETVDRFTNADAQAPSLLPEWTRAHVLTHLARNADGLVNLAHWARTGEEREMYPGGPGTRDADIQAGAGRHIGDLRLDLADASERLLGAFVDFPEEGLGREVIARSGTWLGWELPLMRTREVEIHHVDLGAGYGPGDWRDEFVTRTLDQLAPEFLARGDCGVRQLEDTGGGTWDVGTSGPELSGPGAALLAWLTGRSAGDGLSARPTGPVPAAPRWR